MAPAQRKHGAAKAVQPVLASRARLLRKLDELERSGPVACALMPPGAALPPGWDWLPGSARDSGSGLALLSAAEGVRFAVAPPFPVVAPPVGSGAGDGLDQLRAHLATRRVVGIVLLRLGHYAVGVADDETLLMPKAGHRYVHGRHRAGGQSQHRFEHNRDVWVRELYDELCGHCLPRFDGSMGAPRPEWLALGGDRIVLGGFLERCGAAAPFAGRVLPWRVPVERPGTEALHGAVTAVWSSRVYEVPR